MQLLGSAVSFCAEAPPPAADNKSSTTNTPSPVLIDLENLVGRINDKINQNKTTPADLADNLKEFDALLIKHKNAPETERVEILVRKLVLYMQVLHDPESALTVAKQIKKDFSDVQMNGSTDDVINDLQHMVDCKKIQDSLAPGTPFPDFQESDLAGNPLSISKFKGKVVLIDFWATWCPPCVMQMPDIQKAYNKFHDQGLEVVGVSLDDEKGKLEQFLKARKIPWPQFFDGKHWQNKLAVKYGINQTPTTFLVDKDGKIIKKLNFDDNLDTVIAEALRK